MALGKYTRVDNRRSSTNCCSTVTIIVFVALCLAGVWMMTSSSVVPVQNSDVPPEVQKNEVRQQKSQSNKSSEDRAQPFEDNPGDLPDDATIRDKETNSSKDEDSTNNEGNPNDLEKTSENATGESHENKSEETNINIKDNTDDDTNSEDGPKTGEGNKETKTEDGYSNSKTLERETDASETDSIKQEGSEQGSAEKNVVLDLDDNTSQVNSVGTNDGDKIKEKVVQDKTSEASTGDTPSDAQASNQDVYPSAAQAELLNETNTQNGSWKSQSVESKNEKEAQQSSESKQQTGYIWKNCNVTAGTDYIPCLDNLQAINGLHSTKHYEHRERHCPAEAPTCLVTLPKGYRQPIRWPKSREKIWYYNVPHTKLAEIKGHQNWVKFDGEYLTFPGGGTQFKHGALHYIDFIQEIAPDIAWGSHSRVVLDVGCGVASFGGYLFDRGVLTMSFAPKDEHEAQVQFALERGIPAMSAVMGTKRLPYPGRVFDIVHCARCRVPWHIEGGKLLLELNRLLRPGGYFVWSATPVYQKLPEDVAIWKAMSESIKSICWELIAKQKDKVNGVGVAIYRKPTSNECYEKRSQSEPPLCLDSDDPNAAWNVPLQACLHKVPVNESERGSQWPENWPARLGKPPYWLTSSQVGVYGKSAPDDFTADYEHWKRVVSKSYLNGMGINWSSVRNVMDMRSVYGGFAAALKDLNLWVMNVISIDAPDTLPIIYERGLFGIYHDWCESFSTYPRSYDLLHADHLFSKIKKRCNFVALVAEVDRILRPEGKLIVRDNVETVDELENMFKSMQWEVRLTYSKDKEGLLCVQKSMWRPEESETLTYAIS